MYQPPLVDCSRCSEYNHLVIHRLQIFCASCDGVCRGVGPLLSFSSSKPPVTVEYLLELEATASDVTLNVMVTLSGTTYCNTYHLQTLKLCHFRHIYCTLLPRTNRTECIMARATLFSHVMSFPLVKTWSSRSNVALVVWSDPFRFHFLIHGMDWNNLRVVPETVVWRVLDRCKLSNKVICGTWLVRTSVPVLLVLIVRKHSKSINFVC